MTMCVEQFLKLQQINELKQHLILARLFQVHDEDDRRAILSFAGLDALVPFRRDGDTFSYFTRLYPLLVTRDVVVGGERRLALVVLLENILLAEIATFPDPPQSAAVFRQVIKTYEEWDANGRPRPQQSPQAALAAGLQARRAERQAARRSTRRYKLDADTVLLNFDLDMQIAHLSTNVQPPGIFALALSGTFDLLKSYVIARLRGYLEWKTARTVLPREVTLTIADVADSAAGAAIIQQRLASVHGYSRLTDLLGEQPVDTLLIIWNRDVPRDQLKPIASAFLQEATQQLLPLVQNRSRVFVVLWVSLGGEPLDDFLVVPPVQFPDPNVIVNWFRDRLTLAKVEPEDVEDALERLRRQLEIHQGYPPGIYGAMREIIDDLQRGRRAS